MIPSGSGLVSHHLNAFLASSNRSNFDKVFTFGFLSKAGSLLGFAEDTEVEDVFDDFEVDFFKVFEVDLEGAFDALFEVVEDFEDDFVDDFEDDDFDDFFDFSVTPCSDSFRFLEVFCSSLSAICAISLFLVVNNVL